VVRGWRGGGECGGGGEGWGRWRRGGVVGERRRGGCGVGGDVCGRKRGIKVRGRCEGVEEVRERCEGVEEVRSCEGGGGERIEEGDQGERKM